MILVLVVKYICVPIILVMIAKMLVATTCACRAIDQELELHVHFRPATHSSKMSMLAEKRVREKWCQDPRNTQWSNGELSMEVAHTHRNLGPTLARVSCSNRRLKSYAHIYFIVKDYQTRLSLSHTKSITCFLDRPGINSDLGGGGKNQLCTCKAHAPYALLPL